MSEFTIFIPAETFEDGLPGAPVSSIHVRWHGEAPALSAAARARLEERWAEYLADAKTNHKTLFNGAITRLVSARRQADGEIELHLGPADYKTFVVAHLRDREWFQEHAPEVSAGALGNSVLLTRGDEALLGIRSAKVAAYAGRAHLIGGVLDLLKEAGGTMPVAEDMVSHLFLELREEANVLPGDLAERGKWPRLLSVAQDEFLAQPEAVWQWETVTPLEKIATRLVAEEHSGAVLLNRTKELPQGLWEKLTPVAQHSWRIWSSRSR